MSSSIAPINHDMTGLLQNQVQSLASRSTKSANKSDSLKIERSSAGVAQEFEAVFASMLLKSMRTNMSDEGLFGSDSSDTYGGIFDMFMGRHIAQGSPLGIGQMIQTYVEAQEAASQQTHD